MRKDITRRALLGTGTSLVAAGAAGMLASRTVPADAASASTPIEKLFAQWLAVRNSPRINDEEEFGPAFQEYVALQSAIVTAEPVTARDVAMQLIAETDHFGSDITTAFRERIIRLALDGRA